MSLWNLDTCYQGNFWKIINFSLIKFKNLYVNVLSLIIRYIYKYKVFKRIIYNLLSIKIVIFNNELNIFFNLVYRRWQTNIYNNNTFFS